jgi:2'-5' RNA ligase
MAQKYSLWLVPEGIVNDRLEKTIKELSRKYNTPLFKPHVTLLGSIECSEEEILSKAGEVAGRIKSYEIKLTHTDMLDEFFRALFIRVEETQEVMGANTVARSVFDRNSGPDYMPHLSLLYGDFPEEQKKRILDETGRIYNLMFKAEHIYVYVTSGEVEAWRQVGKFSLKD